jgi:hypothetical protein
MAQTPRDYQREGQREIPSQRLHGQPALRHVVELRARPIRATPPGGLQRRDSVLQQAIALLRRVRRR